MQDPKETINIENVVASTADPRLSASRSAKESSSPANSSRYTSVRRRRRVLNVALYTVAVTVLRRRRSIKGCFELRLVSRVVDFVPDHGGSGRSPRSST